MKQTTYFIPTLVIAVMMSAGAARAADFSESLVLRRIDAPGVAEIADLDNFCSTQASSMEARVKAIATQNSIEIQVFVEGDVEMMSSPTIGSTYTCTAKISGSSDKKIQLINLSESVNHLGRKGFKKTEYAAACDSIAQAYSSNTNEILQRKDLSFTAMDGNYCQISSTVLTIQ